MLTKRWQYPSHSEPVLVPTPPPTVNPDSWHPILERSLFRRANAVYSYPCAWIPERQPLPPTSQGNQPDLLFRRPNLVYSYPSAWIPERQPLPPTSIGSLPDLISRKISTAYITDGGFVPVVTATPPAVLVSSWIPVSTDVFPRKASPVYTENTFVSVVPPPVFGWLPAIDQPVVPKRAQYLYDSSFFHPFPLPNPVTVSVSSWYQPLSEPTRRRVSSAHITENVIPARILPKTVTLDMWFQQTEVPQSHWQTKTGTAQFDTFSAQTIIPITPPIITVISEQNTYIGTGFAEWGSTINTNIGGG